jgi:hypothetical protein
MEWEEKYKEYLDEEYCVKEVTAAIKKDIV